MTENTRACYPINFIDNARIPCTGPHPKNVILLCCDAFGVLPPVSKLSLEQAMYHFISGYTSKVQLVLYLFFLTAVLFGELAEWAVGSWDAGMIGLLCVLPFPCAVLVGNLH